ncbi:hypothetical protein HAX54_013342, partial [Datura stramonium]|nr:hypothetical protein [Datura stramonium]
LREALSLVLSVLMVSSGEEEEVTGCERRGARRELKVVVCDGLWLLLPSPAVERERREEGGGATEVGLDGVLMVFRRAVFGGWEREEPLVAPLLVFPATVRNRGRSGVGFGVVFRWLWRFPASSV